MGQSRPHSPVESDPLLQPNSGTSQSPDIYGTSAFQGMPNGDQEVDSNYVSRASPGIDVNDKSDFDSDSDSDDGAAFVKKRRAQRLQETGGWRGYLKDFSILLPYVVPRKDAQVQLCIIACILALAGERVLNVLTPTQLGIITDKIINGGSEPPYRELLVWLVLNIIHGVSGLEMIQDLAKIPIRQFSERQVANAAYAHVMNLSMDFHTERDSAEVMKAVEQGGALMNVLEMAVNEMLPTVLDLIISFGILYSRFDSSVALTMMTAFATFLVLEILTTPYKIEPRRRYMKAAREEARVMHQGIQGWTTVSYFNSFGYERHRFRQTVDAKLTAHRTWSVRMTCIRAMVELIEPFTFVILAFMIASRVMKSEASPGDFVFFIDYWGYLIWPLKFLMQEYRTVLSDFIDAERLLALFQTNPTVTDRPGAHNIGSVAGHVTFNNVFFAYNPRKVAVSDLTFSAAPGETVAFVGATGAGKSTITKLLLRFYDVASGSIKIDGNDIRDITVSSLRDVIGVVPQDPLLFNATIQENLRYAKPSATDDEIAEACRVAAIHDKIAGFPDGYNTRVGENGVKLSGGEVQRLAIARVVLRDPAILVLDEATSAVDTHTESNIQQALEAFKGTRRRTTFVIAHRLSTIVCADRILVLDEGRVVESGTHTELLERAGRYKELWDKQIGTSTKHSLI